MTKLGIDFPYIYYAAVLKELVDDCQRGQLSTCLIIRSRRQLETIAHEERRKTVRLSVGTFVTLMESPIADLLV